jgi:hypothetical protein
VIMSRTEFSSSIYKGFKGILWFPLMKYSPTLSNLSSVCKNCATSVTESPNRPSVWRNLIPLEGLFLLNLKQSKTDADEDLAKPCELDCMAWWRLRVFGWVGPLWLWYLSKEDTRFVHSVSWGLITSTLLNNFYKIIYKKPPTFSKLFEVGGFRLIDKTIQ